MIRSGTTCFNDMYYLPEETAALVNDIGMRAIICLMGRDKKGTQDSVWTFIYLYYRQKQLYNKQLILSH